jgi:hypothetical protein
MVSLDVAGVPVHGSSEGGFGNRSRAEPEMNRIHCDIGSAHMPLRVRAATGPKPRRDVAAAKMRATGANPVEWLRNRRLEAGLRNETT